MLKENQTIYVIIRSVSKSGMSRKMSFFAVQTWEHDGSQSLRNVTDFVAEILKKKVVSDSLGRKCINVYGSGMDMAFHTIQNLSLQLKINFRHEYL